MSIETIRQLKQEALIPKVRVRKPIPKYSAKRKRQMQEQIENKSDVGLDKWFEDRRKQMSGICVLCNGKTEKNNDETYRRSIHHLFDKRKNMFPSVACHPDNFLEVCFWGNACHSNIHNGNITFELLLDSAEAKIIIEKFKKIYPFIAEHEKRNIPECLMKYVK